MKQRLLLALLMLFSSVGFMKVDAQISITLPKTKKAETVTITFNAKTFKSGDLSTGSYPTFGNASVAAKSTSATQVVYEFKTKTTEDLTLTLDATNRNASTWGDIKVAIDGKVSQFVVTSNPDKDSKTHVLNYITSLSFTNNGELKQLVLASKNAYKTTGLPKLASLSCAENKLNHIPSKLGDDGKDKLTTYNVGEQSPSSTMFTPVNVAEPKKGLTLTTSLFDKESTKIFGQTVTGALTISELKDKDDKVVNYAKSESGKYFFKDGDIFMDGDFTAKIAVGSDDKNYPGVVICGVPVTVNPATFELKAEKIKITPEGAGSIVSDPTDLSGLKRELVIKLTPKYNSGYEFEKFQNLVGLESVGQDGNTYSFKVLGDKDPEIEAVFKAKGATVTYNTPDAAQGTLRVTKAENNELVASGNTVPVGTKLLITAKAKDGYQVEDGNVSFKMADKSTSVIEDKLIAVKTDASEKTWTYEVTIDGLDVQAAFKGLSYSLKNASSTQNITIKDIKGTSYSWNTEKSAWEIPVNTELIFTYSPSGGDTKVVSSVVINSKSYEVTQMQDGKFTWKGFVMPNEESSMTVTLSELKSITVNLVKNEFAYNGQEQKVDFTVNKNVDKTSFKVEYKVKDADDATYTEKPFANCGTYIARITRPADGEYAAYVKGFEYTIDQAQLIVEAPTVTVDEDGKFVFTGGKAYYMNGDTKVELTGGKFVAISSSSSSEIEEPEQNDDGKVKVKYRLPETVLETNFEVPNSTEVIYDSEVATATIQAVGVYKDALTFKNGNLVLPSSSKVAQGTTVTFDYEKVDGISTSDKLTYAVYRANANGEKLSGATDLKSVGYTIKETDKDQTLYFLLEVKDERGKLNLSAAAVSYIKKGFIYGNSWNLLLSANSDKELYFVDEENNKVSETKAYENISITYYKNGVKIAEVVDAGDYQVEISRPACDKYTEFKSEKISFTVSPAEIPQATTVEAKSATAVGLGQPLSTSKITGVSDIAGKFVWNEDETVILTTDGQHKVKFVPESNNYKAKELSVLTVNVSTQPLLTVDCDSEQGRVEIKDTENNYYYDGDLIITDESKPATKAIETKTLTITAVPADGFVFESFTFIKGGVESTVKTNPCTQSVSDASLDVKANFKEKSAEIVYHKINISTSGVGFAVSTTSGSVKEGDSFNFSLSAHPSDYSRIVVRDNNGKSYTVSNLGDCTIDNVQEDLQLTVSLSDPTRYAITLQQEYKDSEGNLIGTASVSGNTYYGGTITLTAVPKEGYKFVSWLNSGTTISTLATAQVTVISNMTITARFESDGTIDPDTECIVRTPYDEDVAGVHINKQGINVVKIGSNFEFSVAAYEADLARVKVTVDGVELKPDANNKYVLEKVQKSTEVKVTLANPTRIKVVVEKETKNAKGYVMGHVDVEGLFSDSTCYYNTTIRLAAYPESGVEFMNWSDVTSNTQLIRELTITKELTIKPVFSGTPTGIEDIMAASIATGKGCVWVRGIANADVTIVSMAGRVQARQRISGDTRINVPAGIYVILLESGSDVKRAKVIVK